MERKAIIREIHIRKQVASECVCCKSVYFGIGCPACGSTLSRELSEDRYRIFLAEITGKRSCSDMSMEELSAVISQMDKVGWPEYAELERRNHRESRKRTIGIIIASAKNALGESWEERLCGFMAAKIGKERLWSCTDNELRMLIGWLRRTERFGKRKNTER